MLNIDDALRSLHNWHLQPSVSSFAETIWYVYQGHTFKLLHARAFVYMFVGLSFLFIETKELCEARAKLEMSSNLADEPTLADVLPPPIRNCPFETARALSELYAFQCCQWEPIRNSQLIRKYKEI